MSRVSTVLRATTATALLAGVALLLVPSNVSVTPLGLPELPVVPDAPFGARAQADSLAEDIILYNLFSASRVAPSRRYPASGVPGAPDEDVPGMAAGGGSSPSAGFTPALAGTVVSERPGGSMALLQLTSADATPRLYAVGEGAGGYRVVSIEARSVVLAGPRGRVVLRLPQDKEDNS
jgi:hypothetical protein